MSPLEIEAAAAELYRAERERTQVRPVSTAHPQMTLDDAYRIQQAVVDRKLDDGRSIVGRKIGLTSRAMQRAMHIDEPDYGTLLDDMLFASGSHIEAARFTDPRIEVEFAFLLGERLFGEALSVDDVLDATAEVLPALALVAARRPAGRAGSSTP